MKEKLSKISTILTFFILLYGSLLFLAYGTLSLFSASTTMKAVGIILILVGCIISFITYEIFQIEKITKEVSP